MMWRCIPFGYTILVVLVPINFDLLSARDIISNRKCTGNILEDDDDKLCPVYFVNTSNVVFETEDMFLSFSIDTKSIRDGLNKTLLRNSNLINLLSYLLPGYLRIGGTESDRLMFQEDSSDFDNSVNRPTKHVNESFFMTAEDWLAINTFAKRARFKILFDMNVLLRRGSSWDSSNARQLLDFSARHNLSVDWQLGNEPNAFQHVFNTTLCPRQLADDYGTLRNILNSYRAYQNSSLVGPEVTSPRRKKQYQGVERCAGKYLSEFVTAGGGDQVGAISWHHYYLRSNSSESDFLDPNVFDSLKTVIFKVKRSSHKSNKPLWISECGSASGGGAAGLTDRFLASFLFLDRLGLAAKHGISLLVRQSLCHGSYALIHLRTITPNPDWWVSFIYKTLVTGKVLSIKSTLQAPRTLRLYAHCSHNRTAVVFGLNLANTTQVININSTSGSKAGLYQLTAPHLLSREVLLNGKSLQTSGKVRPSLRPLPVSLGQPPSLQPFSMFFLHISDSYSQYC